MTRPRQYLAAIGLIVLGVVLLWLGMGLAFMGHPSTHVVHIIANWMMQSCVYVGGLGALWLVWLIVLALKDKFSSPRWPPPD